MGKHLGLPSGRQMHTPSCEYELILLQVLPKPKELIQDRNTKIFTDLGPLCGFVTALLTTSS